MIRYDRFIAVVAVHVMFSTVLGCGGGSSSGNQPTPSPPPPPSVLSITSSNAPAIAAGTFGTAESVLMVADEAVFALQKVDDTALYTFPHNCLRGSATYAHGDTDGNGVLSANDVVDVSYNSCQTSVSNGRLDGSIRIEVSTVDDVRGKDEVHYIARILSGSLEISRDSGDLVRMYGEYEVEYVRGIYQSSLIARPIFANAPEVGDLFESLYRDFEFQKLDDYETATYSISISGALISTRFSGVATFSTVEPFTAPLNTYPLSGSLEISGGDSSKMRVQPDDLLLDQYSLLVDENGDGTFSDIGQNMPWDTITEGHIWWYELSSPNEYQIAAYDLNDFRIMNWRPFDRGSLGREIIGVNSPIRVQASRPINPASIPASLRLEQYNEEWPFVGYFIDLDIEVRGAMLIFRPTRQLSPGGGYQLDIQSFWISDMNGNQDSISWYDSAVVAVELLESITDPDEAYGFPGDQISLSGLSSTSVEAADLTFEWTQVLGPTAQIMNADSAVPIVTLPTVSQPELVRLHLRVINEFGEYDYAKTDLSVFPGPDEIDVAIMRGRKPDGSQHELLYTPANGEQTYFYNGVWAVGIENETDYVVPRSSGGSTGFRLDLDLSFTVPYDDIFEIGSYTNITEDSTGDISARMSIRRTMKCYEYVGEFHVLEFELDQNGDVERLAIDYQAQCADGEEYEHISGHVRKRSVIPIPPAP
jgi:hypothetical protein